MNWSELWAFCRLELQLSEAEFWRSPYSRLAALIQVWRARLERDDFRAGVLIATVEGLAGAEAPDVWKYFPQHKPKAKEAAAASTHAERIRQNFQRLIAAQQGLTSG